MTTIMLILIVTPTFLFLWPVSEFHPLVYEGNAPSVEHQSDDLCAAPDVEIDQLGLGCHFGTVYRELDLQCSGLVGKSRLALLLHCHSLEQPGDWWKRRNTT